MIVSVRDSNSITKNAVIAAAMLAGITSIGKSKNTLILQFTKAEDISVLDMMAGKSIRRNTLKSIYSFSDDGIDGISIRAESNLLTREHFDSCVTQLLDKDNMLAVLKPTRNEKYREVQSEDIFSKILIGAQSVYEYIYVIIPSEKEDEKLVELVTGYTDENLITIPQGPKVDGVKTDKKTNLVVINYEATSKFNVSSMKNAYGVRHLYTIPYNVGCRDARISESLLDYLLVNRKDTRTDDNYVLFSSLNTLVSRYVTNKEEDDDEPDVKEQPEKSHSKLEKTVELPEDAIQEVIVKKGLFRKKEKKIMINL